MPARAHCPQPYSFAATKSCNPHRCTVAPRTPTPDQHPGDREGERPHAPPRQRDAAIAKKGGNPFHEGHNAPLAALPSPPTLVSPHWRGDAAHRGDRAPAPPATTPPRPPEGLWRAVRVDIFDRLPVPYGLIRSGVAPDHQSIKAVSRRYEATALSDKVRFVGNVAVGRDVSIDELLELYDAVILATGAPHDRAAGHRRARTLPNVFGSAAFVGWYNGHPDFAALDPDLSGTDAVVIGMGNVALDVARILAKTRGRVRRRGHRRRTRSTRSRASRIERDHHPGPARPAPDHDDAQGTGRTRRICARRAASSIRPTCRHRTTDALAGSGPAQVGRPCCAIRRAAREWRASRSSSPSISSPRPQADRRGWPRRADRGRADRGRGRPRGRHRRDLHPPRRPRRRLHRLSHLARSPACRSTNGGAASPTTRPDPPRSLCVGWARRGPTGTIGTNRPDGFAIAERIAVDVPTASGRAGGAGLDALLASRGVRVVTFTDWQRIDAAEVARARIGAPREKFVSTPAMLDALD